MDCNSVQSDREGKVPPATDVPKKSKAWQQKKRASIQSSPSVTSPPSSSTTPDIDPPALVKEVYTIQKNAESVIRLTKEFEKMKVKPNVQLRLRSALVNPEQVSGRTPLEWGNMTRLAEKHDLKASWCRTFVWFNDYLNSYKEIGNLNFIDYQALFKLRFAPVSWMLWSWQSYRHNVNGVTFTNDAWYPFDEAARRLTPEECQHYYHQIPETMTHGINRKMKKLSMTEEEYSCMLAIILFRSDYRLSKETSILLQSIGDEHTKALSELVYTRQENGSELEALQRLSELMSMITDVQNLARQEDENVIYLAIFKHAEMEFLPYETHSAAENYEAPTNDCCFA